MKKATCHPARCPEPEGVCVETGDCSCSSSALSWEKKNEIDFKTASRSCGPRAGWTSEAGEEVKSSLGGEALNRQEAGPEGSPITRQPSQASPT